MAVIAAGWGASRCRLLQQACTDDQAVSLLNVLVMRVCLPALQLQLLAIYSDMRHMQNWRCARRLRARATPGEAQGAETSTGVDGSACPLRASPTMVRCAGLVARRLLAAFMLWTAVIQAGAGAWVVLFEGGRLERWGVHALVLAANNTGILAPVVLEAAVGECGVRRGQSRAKRTQGNTCILAPVVLEAAVGECGVRRGWVVVTSARLRACLRPPRVQALAGAPAQPVTLAQGRPRRSARGATSRPPQCGPHPAQSERGAAHLA